MEIENINIRHEMTCFSCSSSQFLHWYLLLRAIHFLKAQEYLIQSIKMLLKVLLNFFKNLSRTTLEEHGDGVELEVQYIWLLGVVLAMVDQSSINLVEGEERERGLICRLIRMDSEGKSAIRSSQLEVSAVLFKIEHSVVFGYFRVHGDGLLVCSQFMAFQFVRINVNFILELSSVIWNFPPLHFPAAFVLCPGWPD